MTVTGMTNACESQVGYSIESALRKGTEARANHCKVGGTRFLRGSFRHESITVR